MKWIRVLQVMTAFAAAVIVAGCSGGHDPISTGDQARSAESFFGCIEAFEGSSEEPFRDLDIATVIEKGMSPSGCLPADITRDGQSHNFSIIVSLKDSETTGKTPMYRWLMDDGTAICDETVFGIPGVSTVDYKFPKVDAIYNPVSGVITVAVSYMWKCPVAPPPWNNWRIGVIFLKWNDDDFDEETMPGYYDSDLWVDQSGYFLQWGHDIAFNHYSAELFLVFTEQTLAMTAPYRLFYRVLRESGGQWGASEKHWAVDSNMIGNMWLPDVDVGRLNMHDLHPDEYPDPWPIDFVGVAFTYQEPDEPFKIGFNYWAPSVDGYGDQEEWSEVLVTPNSDYDTGLPSLDIAPNNTAEHYYALAYVQATDDDQEYDVWLADSINNDFKRLIDDDYEDEENGYRERTLPSVACHYSGLYDKAVSVSMYQCPDPGEPTGSYIPTAVNFDIDSNETGEWQSVQAGYNTITGIWWALDVAYMDSGVATDIVLTDDNHYYLGFADSIDNDYPPTTVYAAWGNTE